MLTILLALLPGSGVGYTITQWPKDAIKRAGESVDLTCYQNHSTLAYMFWYQQLSRSSLKLIASTATWIRNSYEEGYSEAKFEISRDKNNLSVMTIKNVTSKDAATYFCAASDRDRGKNRVIFGDGTRLSVIEKNNEIIPPAVAIFSPSKQEIQQKNKATLVCLASGFYPDHLNLVWKVNGVKRTEGVGTDEISTPNGSTYSLTSRLRISAEEWFNPLNRFECIAEFFKNATLESIHKFIYGDTGCDIFSENYQRSATAGKFVYIMLIFKSVLYGIFLMGMMLWYKKMY